MKNILVLAHDDAAQEARLQAALDVTRAMDGHLTCLEVVELPLVVTDYYATGATETLVAERIEAGAELRVRLENRLLGEDVIWSITQCNQPLPTALERHADLSNLIVVSSRLDPAGGKAGQAKLEPLPLKSRRAMLAVPPSCRGIDVNGTAVIAWDGTASCHEAMGSALPMLKRAAGVTMIEVNRPDGAFAMHDAASYLSRHGVAATLVERQTSGTIAHILLDHAVAVDADYFVMGAYGMPPAAERVFGGVTRTMLMHSALPLLLAH